MKAQNARQDERDRASENPLLASLNEAQRQAVTTTEGYVRVIAGAGTGKTRALAHRFAWLVNELGILPGNILCVTFTNKAAREMRRRIHRLTGDNDAGYICTFHSFCVSVLHEDIHAIQYPDKFLVLDNSDIDDMLGIIYEERGLTLADMPYSKARDMIEVRKIHTEPLYYQNMIALPLEEAEKKYREATAADDIIFYGYLYQEKKCFGLDYNDLIIITLHIFEQNSQIRQKWQERLEYVMIDEFQDIDELQYRLMTVLCGHHKNLFIVGDPDQTIYTWRGANVRYLLDFDKVFPETATIMMLQNYRSSPQIIAVVNSLIARNENRIKKELLAELPPGGPVIWRHCKTGKEEAKWIASRLARLHGEGTDWDRMAVLYRAHHVTRPLEQALVESRIPYSLYSGVEFFGRREIRDALAWLRMVDSGDDLSFLRTVNSPRRNIGKRRIQYLREYASSHGCSLFVALQSSLGQALFANTTARAYVELVGKYAGLASSVRVSELLAGLLNESGYEAMLRTEGSQERLDNLAELRQAVYEFETSCGEEATLAGYLANVAIFGQADRPEGKGVKLMTIHTAKGLEFPHVFVCALNEGIFPSGRTKTREGMEEERRLAFVAMTRARHGLYLCEAEGRNFDGSPRYPSRFVLDIDQKLLECSHSPDARLLADARDTIALSNHRLVHPANVANASQSASHDLQPGTRVKHTTFGPGVIEAIDQDGNAWLIRFDKLPTARKISFRARLEKLG